MRFLEKCRCGGLSSAKNGILHKIQGCVVPQLGVKTSIKHRVFIVSLLPTFQHVFCTPTDYPYCIVRIVNIFILPGRIDTMARTMAPSNSAFGTNIPVLCQLASMVSTN